MTVLHAFTWACMLKGLVLTALWLRFAKDKSPPAFLKRSRVIGLQVRESIEQCVSSFSHMGPLSVYLGESYFTRFCSCEGLS